MTLNPETFFNLLSDPTRLRSLLLLQQEGELCVCEFTHTLQMVQPKISRHLALLRKHNIVSDRREGLWIYYQLHKDLPAWAIQTLSITAKANQPLKPYSADLKRLSAMPNRPSKCCPPKKPTNKKQKVN